MTGRLRVSQLLIAFMIIMFVGLPYLLEFESLSSQTIQSMIPNSSASSSQSIDPIKLANFLTEGELKELRRVFARATMRNKTVIITTLNEAWAAKGTMIDLFLLSFRRGKNITHLLNHVVIVTLDRKAHERCVQLHPHCFKLRTDGVNYSLEKKFMTEDYVKMMWRRIEFLAGVLEMGYSFVFSDADILWFRDPFTVFSEDKDFQIACDKYSGGSSDVLTNAPNGGFVYVRSNRHTIAMYTYWYAARLRIPGKHDQDVLGIVLREESFEQLGIKIRFLETLYFSGFCQISKDIKQVITVHANCCKGGLNNKLMDLQLALDDWHTYNNLKPSTRDERLGIGENWRVPSSCRRPKRSWWRFFSSFGSKRVEFSRVSPSQNARFITETH